MLTATAGVAIAAGGFGSIGHVGVETLVIVAVYLVGMRGVYRNSVPATAPPDQLELGENSRTLLWRGVRGFALATVGLALTSPLLVLSASAVAAEGGVTETFIGTLLVGFTTSFPEIAATIAAVRIGALDLAVGNIFGSNAFNMCVLLGMDLAYSSGPVLAHASRDHLVSAQLAVLAIGLGILAMLARRSRRLGRVRIESVLVVLAYAGAAWLLALRSYGLVTVGPVLADLVAQAQRRLAARLTDGREPAPRRGASSLHGSKAGRGSGGAFRFDC